MRPLKSEVGIRDDLILLVYHPYLPSIRDDFLMMQEAKVEYIETALGPAMVNLGRMTSEELNNRRDAMRAARA